MYGAKNEGALLGKSDYINAAGIATRIIAFLEGMLWAVYPAGTIRFVTNFISLRTAIQKKSHPFWTLIAHCR